MTAEQLEQEFGLWVSEMSKKYNKSEDEVLNALLGVVKEEIKCKSTRK